MKIFVINLKRDERRLHLMLNQLQKFNITDFEIVEAVDGKSLYRRSKILAVDHQADKLKYLENTWKIINWAVINIKLGA